MTCRLIVADPLPVVRAGLRSFFHETDAIIVDEAQTSEQAVVKTLEALPDALLLDVQFPDKSGFEVVEELRKNDYNGRIVFFADDERLACFARLGVERFPATKRFMVSSAPVSKTERIARRRIL